MQQLLGCDIKTKRLYSFELTKEVDEGHMLVWKVPSCSLHHLAHCRWKARRTY